MLKFIAGSILFFLVGFALAASLQCASDTVIQPEPLNLTYSSYLELPGYSNWKSGWGMTVFVIVKNNGERAKILPYVKVHGREKSLGSAFGQLTTKLDRETHVPTDKRNYIGSGEELESITFVPITIKEFSNFSYVEWGFVKEEAF